MANSAEHLAIERRIERLVIFVGGAVTAGAAMGWGFRAGLGAASGAILCAINFRWLRHGATGLMQLSMEHSGAERVRVPLSVHARFFGRLVLLLVVAYVILALVRLPAVAFLCGAVAVVPAILLELAYELAQGRHRWKPL